MPAKGQSLSRTLEATRRTLRAGPVWGRVGTAHENPRASSREVPTDTRQRQDLPGQNQQNEHRKRQEAPELISSMAPTEKGPEAGASWCTAASRGKRDRSATKAYRVLPNQLGAAESPGCVCRRPAVDGQKAWADPTSPAHGVSVPYFCDVKTPACRT